MSAAFEALMRDVCVGHGYCGSIVGDKPCHVTDFIPETGVVSADQFVGWVFDADDTDAYQRARHAPALREMFVRNMGGEVADARLLRWE